jgi:hypothetical protein
VNVILDEILDCEVTLQDFMSNKQRRVWQRECNKGKSDGRKLPTAVYNKRIISAKRRVETEGKGSFCFLFYIEKEAGWISDLVFQKISG